MTDAALFAQLPAIAWDTGQYYQEQLIEAGMPGPEAYHLASRAKAQMLFTLGEWAGSDA